MIRNSYNQSKTPVLEITNSPKGKDRSPEGQQVKSSRYSEWFSSKIAIVFLGPKYSNDNSLNVPENKPFQAFMYVFFTHNFDDISINTEQTNMSTSLSNHKSIGYFRHSRPANSAVSVRIRQKIEFIQDFMQFLVTCSLIHSQWYYLLGIHIHPISYACPHYLQVL